MSIPHQQLWQHVTSWPQSTEINKRVADRKPQTWCFWRTEKSPDSRRRVLTALANVYLKMSKAFKKRQKKTTSVTLQIIFFMQWQRSTTCRHTHTHTLTKTLLKFSHTFTFNVFFLSFACLFTLKMITEGTEPSSKTISACTFFVAISLYLLPLPMIPKDKITFSTTKEGPTVFLIRLILGNVQLEHYCRRTVGKDQGLNHQWWHTSSWPAGPNQ